MAPTLIIPILAAGACVADAARRLWRWHRDDGEPREVGEAIVEAGLGLMLGWILAQTSLYVQLVITVPLVVISPLAVREATRRKALEEAEEAKRLAAGAPPE